MAPRRYQTYKNGKHSIVFDVKLADKIFAYAIDAFDRRILGYHRMQQPEIIYRPSFFMPTSLEHSQWIFFATSLNRFGQGSNRAMERFITSLQLDRCLIDPNADFESVDFQNLLAGVAGFVKSNVEEEGDGQLNFDLGEDYVEVAISKELGKQGQERVDGWRNNLQLLRDQYHGDPRNILLEAERSREGIIEAFSQFDGFAAKLAQLGGIWYQDVKWPKYKNDWDVIHSIKLMPVDLWILRLLRQWEIIVEWTTDQHDAARSMVSDFMVDRCVECDFDHSKLSNSCWHCGQICVDRPKNDGATGWYCLQSCPFEKYCKHICGGSDYKKNGTMRWNKAYERRPVGVESLFEF